MRYLIVSITLTIFFSCKVKDKISQDRHHYIKYRLYKGSAIENSNRVYNIQLQKFNLIKPNEEVYYINGIEFNEGEKINVCNDFYFSNDGEVYTNNNLFQKTKSVYNKRKKSRPFVGDDYSADNENYAMGLYGCGPGLFFIEDNGNIKLVETKLKVNNIVNTYIPVSMALHHDHHPHNTELKLTPTYYQIDTRSRNNIISLLQSGHTYTGTDSETVLVDVDGRQVALLLDLKLCKSTNKESCKKVN